MKLTRWIIGLCTLVVLVIVAFHGDRVSGIYWRRKAKTDGYRYTWSTANPCSCISVEEPHVKGSRKDCVHWHEHFD